MKHGQRTPTSTRDPLYVNNRKSKIRIHKNIRNIKKDTSEAKSKIMYESRKGPVSIWGGAVVENIVQALARCIVGEQMLEISKEYRPC